MKPGSRRCLLALAALMLGAAGSAGAASGGWIALTNKASGFRLTVPSSSFVIPGDSVARTRALIRQLQQQKQARLAAVYESILDSSDVTRFAFEAFFYSPTAPVQPLVTLSVSRTTNAHASASGLKSIVQSSAASLTKNGATIEQSGLVTLPAGPAAFVKATQSVSGTATIVETYVIGHGALLYQLTFRTSAATKSGLATFTAIARRFAVT